MTQDNEILLNDNQTKAQDKGDHHKGLFITFEGGEGGGKSTQIFRTADQLRLAGLNVVVTREPGGTEVGERIREIIVSGDTDRCLPMTELLLVTAARLEHINKVIKPSLEKGMCVLCDRFVHSTLVYQCFVQHLPEERYNLLHENFLDDFMPDMTFFFDIDVKVGLARTKGRSHNEDRFEKKSIDFHEAVRQGFIEQYKNSNERGILIDATLSQNDITKSILKEIAGYLST